MTLLRVVARPMMASMFVVGGINSLRNAPALASTAKPVTDKIIPQVRKAAPTAPIPEDVATLVRINGAAQVVGGLMLATGRFPRLSSLLLAATLAPTTAAGHAFWRETDPTAKANQQVHFFKNVSMAGGLLMAGIDSDPSKKLLVTRARESAVEAGGVVREKAAEAGGAVREKAAEASKQASKRSAKANKQARKSGKQAAKSSRKAAKRANKRASALRS